MASIIRQFNGKLNLDTHNDRVPPQDYVDALNITRDAEGDAQDAVVSNIRGNVLVQAPATSTVLVGVVANMNYSARPFSNTDVQNAVASLGHLDILRYPGGDISNEFNWQTGLPDDGSGQPSTLDDVSSIYHALGIDILFVLNMCTKPLPNQLAMLAAAAAKGIPIKYIELGNEINVLGSNGHTAYPTAADYAAAIAIWIPAIKAVYPNVLITAVGGNKGWSPTWNATILAENPDALSWHVKTFINNFWNGSIIDYAAIDTDIDNDWTSSGFDTVTTVPIWATEFNYDFDIGNIIPENVAQAVTLYMLQQLPAYLILNSGIKMMCVRTLESIKQGALIVGKTTIIVQATGYALRQYSASLPVGTNKVIGSKDDALRNRVYYFVWNSNDFDSVLYYDKDTDSIVKLITNITDTGGEDILNFNPSYKINCIDIIYRDEGDLLSWTDGYSTPKEINVATILAGTYSPLQINFIEAAKRPPLIPPICVYGSDTTRTSNALRRKMFMASYAWKYDTFAISTPSQFSKIPLPIGFYGSDNDIDSSKNNFITISVETGDKNVTDIEIYIRQNIVDAWGNFVIVVSLNKAQLNIPDNDTYQYLFYNDNLYPQPTENFQYADGVQIVPLFDWLPQLADVQCQPNGNVKSYAAITENYDNYPVNDLDVTITAENVTNIPPDTDPPSITYTQYGLSSFTFTVSGSVPAGTEYKIYIFFNGNTSLGQTYGVRLVADYTATLGDTVNDVAFALYTQMGAFSATPPIILGSIAGNTFNVNFGSSGSYVSRIDLIPGTSAGTISTEKTWLWECPYSFGIVYFDEQGRDMPGVTTFTNPTDTDNDFLVTTPPFSQSGGSAQTPVISAAINHLPPDGSVRYTWVRRRLQYGTFLFYETCDFQDGTDTDPNDNYFYFCLANIDKYKEANTQFIYGTAPISAESRIKIIAGINVSQYTSDLWTQDYQILGTVVRTVTNGTSPANDVTFIKVAKPATTITPTYTANMLVMVYTPMLNPTDNADSVYWEWGESYDTYTGYTITYTGLSGTFEVGETITGGTSGATAIVVSDSGTQLGVSDVVGIFQNGETITGGTSSATATFSSISSGVLYHRGLDQDQTSTEAAEFTWPEGDVYFHERSMFPSLLGSPPFSIDTVSVMDANFSDFFDSAVNDNGRAQAIEVNARRQFNPVLQRFSEAYQSGTNINGLNRFYPENFDEYDRSWGKIVREYINERLMYVFQELNVGVVPILTQIVRDTAGNPLEANSDILLNKIAYPYSKQYGLGNVPESFAYGENAMYGFDNNKGVVWRLSQNGMEGISIQYECANFFVQKAVAYKTSLNNGYPILNGVYTGNPTVYGVFDTYTNKYIIALEEIKRYNSQGSLIFHQDPYTFGFLETRDSTEGFESKYSYFPEYMDCLNNLLITFRNGELWRHDSTIYCQFYGDQFSAYITPVFNDGVREKKTWEALTQVSDTIWECPEMYTNVNSYAGQRQESRLVEDDFTVFEEYPSAAILRDTHSIGGTYNGEILKGGFMVIKFQKTDANELVILNSVEVLVKESPLNQK